MPNIVFAGTPEIARMVLEQLLNTSYNITTVYSQPDRPAGRGRRLQAPPVKQLAEKHHIPVYQPEVFDLESQHQLRNLQPDLMIVVAYGLLLPEAVLSIPRLGCINVHVSLLPRWRGAAPIARAIEAGDVKTGVSIMQMDKGLDTGPVFKQVTCSIKPTDTSDTLSDTLAQLGALTLVEFLPSLFDGVAMATPQASTGASYAKKLRKEEGIIHWQEHAEVILYKIHALNPWPVAFTSLKALTLRVFDAEVIDTTATDHIAGTILNASKQGLDVACGNGVLRILKAQLPGGKILSVRDLLNAKSDLFKIGSQLGKL